MIVFRFDDLTTIGNHVRNMPCGSPCRFVISKGGDSSATVVLTSNGRTISATSEDISPFSTDEYVGFDIVTPEESANIPYHAVITGTNEVHDIDFILNCTVQTLCGDIQCSVKIDDIESIGSRCYTFPTNSYVGLEVDKKYGNYYLSLSSGIFPWVENINNPSNIDIPFSKGAFGGNKLRLLTPNQKSVTDTVIFINSFTDESDGVYGADDTVTRFTGYDKDGNAAYTINVCPKGISQITGLYNNTESTKDVKYVQVYINDLEENTIASAIFSLTSKSYVSAQRIYIYSYTPDKDTIKGTWEEYFPIYLSYRTARNKDEEPAKPTSATVLTDYKQPDNKTTGVSCEGKEKLVYVSKPITQFGLTVTSIDTGFSYSK